MSSAPTSPSRPPTRPPRRTPHRVDAPRRRGWRGGATRVLLAGALAAASLATGPSSEALASPPTVDELLRRGSAPEILEARLARYVPVELGVDGAKIPAAVRPMLPHLLRAAEQMDAIFWQQVSPHGRAMHAALASSDAPGARALAELLAINYGPWDRFADDRPLIAGIPRPPGANLYPSDLSRHELDTWFSKHPGASALLRSPYTVVRRQGAGLSAVPYSDAYLPELKAASDALRAAADAYHCAPDARERGACLCDDLVQFLRARADAFLLDDYRASELAWVDARSCPVDIAIGPYEYYEDRLLGLKTAFEAIILLRDDTQARRMAALHAAVPAMLEQLPVSEAIRARLQPVHPTPITIADVLYTAGDARAGYQVRAFLLPNDEAVRLARGQKHVVLRNVVRAKYDALVRPLAERVLDPSALAQISFDAYFDHLLAWQLAHGVVVGPIALPDGSTATSRELLRERYTIIEAVKGEALALWNYFQLADAGLVDDPKGEKIGATYLTTLFDASRVATDSPQAIARTIVYNYLTREWVFRYRPGNQTLEVNSGAMRDATRKLAAEALEVLVRGDYDGAGRLIAQHGIVSAEVRQKLAALDDLPLDIRPRYISAVRAARPATTR